MSEQLMRRVDNCMAVVGASDAIAETTRVTLQKQGMFYAAFLSDLDAGRVTGSTTTQKGMLDAIGEFCDLTEANLSPAT